MEPGLEREVGHYNVLCLWDFRPGTADLGLSEAARRQLAGATSLYEAMTMAKQCGQVRMASVAEVAPHLDYPLGAHTAHSAIKDGLLHGFLGVVPCRAPNSDYVHLTRGCLICQKQAWVNTFARRSM